MFWLKIVGRILRTLKEGGAPAQIALGFVLGWAIGLVPGWPVQVWLLLVVLLVLQANLTMALVGAAVASALAWLLDPLLDALGAAVLHLGALQGLFTRLYNSPPWGLTRFNNTAVMGSSVAAVVCAVVFFPLVIWGVRAYRERFLERISRWRIAKMLKGTKIVRWYQRLQELGLV